MNVSCKSIGCDQNFKLPVQKYRQLRTCKYPPILPESKYERIVDKFECKKCQKVYSHQLNVVRHVNSCKGVQERVMFECSVCQKHFHYKGLLLKHEPSQNQKVYGCKNCF